MMDNVASGRALMMGLAGLSVVAMPTPALAAQAALDSTSYATFALGCVTGAAITGAAALVIDVRTRRRDDVPVGHGSSTQTSQGGAHRRMLGSAARGAAPSQAGGLSAHPSVVAASEWEPEIRVQELSQEYVPSPSVDQSDMVTGYVRFQSMTEQMAVRAAGVRDTLMSRLGKGFFDDLPIIERADGSIGDVGEGWWDARFGRQVGHRPEGPAFADTKPTLGEYPDPSSLTTGRLDRALREGSQGMPGQTFAVTAETKRSSIIASRLAGLDLDAFPLRRTSAELDSVDTFDQALAAMDERLGRRMGVPPFLGTLPLVGALDDEPSVVESDEQALVSDPSVSLRRSTDRMADASEDVLEDGWLDSLADEWTASHQSRAGYQSTESFLRVIQGGKGRGHRSESGPSDPVDTSGGRRRGGRHFASSHEAVAL